GWRPWVEVISATRSGGRTLTKLARHDLVPFPGQQFTGLAGPPRGLVLKTEIKVVHTAQVPGFLGPLLDWPVTRVQQRLVEIGLATAQLHIHHLHGATFSQLEADNCGEIQGPFALTIPGAVVPLSQLVQLLTDYAPADFIRVIAIDSSPD